MKEKIISYIELMFAGAPNTPETKDSKEEILQNTLAHFDDMIDSGISPEEAYNKAISGIGDISEIIAPKPPKTADEYAEEKRHREKNATKSRLMLAIAVCLYICCVIPVIAIQNVLGVCLMFIIAGVATALVIFRPKYDEQTHGTARFDANHEEQSELDKQISSLIGTITLVTYLIVSFSTGAWYISWVIFLIGGAVTGLVKAIWDLVRKDNK